MASVGAIIMVEEDCVYVLEVGAITISIKMENWSILKLVIFNLKKRERRNFKTLFKLKKVGAYNYR